MSYNVTEISELIERLEPCPFCPNDENHVQWREFPARGGTMVRCDEHTEFMPIAEWNRRAIRSATSVSEHMSNAELAQCLTDAADGISVERFADRLLMRLAADRLREVEEHKRDAQRWRALRNLSHHIVLEIIQSDWSKWEHLIDERIAIDAALAEKGKP